MSLRMAALATFIAALPLSVDAPGDSTARSGETRVEVVGARSQYGIVTRGCDNSVLDVVHRQLRGGALVIEHETPAGIVIGARAGEVQERQAGESWTDGYGNTYTSPAVHVSNRYVNPFVAYEGTHAGIGLGLLRSEHGVILGEGDYEHIEGTGHLRIGRRDGPSLTMRLFEDVPLQSQGALSLDFVAPVGRWEVGPTLGLAGPYDGMMAGGRVRVWLTPAAAATVRAGLGGFSQYQFSGGLTARWPAPR